MLAKSISYFSTLTKRGFHVTALLHNNIVVETRKQQNSDSQLPRNVKNEPSELAKESIPIERKSLTRGIALNKFEKDFMIYPEHDETEEYENIRSYVNKVSADYSNAAPVIKAQSDDSISAHALQVLQRNAVYSTFVPKEFGGYGFNQKDLSMLSETLGGEDLSLFLTFNQAQSAAVLISIFGTEEQKTKYLPAIASFQCKPAICIYDENTGDAISTEVWNVKGQKALLSGVKTNVINANLADLFIVFAKTNVGDTKKNSCYIIERNNLGGGSISIQERIKTQGLNAIHFSKVNFRDVVVNSNQLLGTDSANDMLDELRLNGKTFYGSAVVGFLKKLTKQLAEFANGRTQGNARVADLHPVQSAMTNLAIGIYALESMVYYISGLCDEDLFLLNDVENSIMQRYANKILRESIITMMDIAGMYATNEEFPFDRTIRDSMTLISTTESDLQLVRRIALPTIETFINEHGSLSTFMSKFTVQKIFRGDWKREEHFRNPKPTHFIAEHVHPSVEISARSLEQSMSRIKLVIDQLLTDRGLYIKDDYFALRELSTVLENTLGMTATIARASRSYSIGLRGAEDEMHWCNYYCEMAAKQNENILQEVLNFFGIISLNPKLTLAGKAVLDKNGYFMENPVERNW